MIEDKYGNRMDRIIDWVKVCDTKASIMLTLVGLMASFIFTSDHVLDGVQAIFRSFVEYDFAHVAVQDINVYGVLAIVTLLITLYCMFGALYRFIMVVYSKPQEPLNNTNPSFIIRLFNFVLRYKWNKDIDPDTKKDSLIHFYHISDLDFKTFSESIISEANTYEEFKDYISQIFINAKRCREKFDDYNSAIQWMLFSLPFLGMFFFFLLRFGA